MASGLQDLVDQRVGAERSLRDVRPDQITSADSLGAVLNLPVTIKIVLGSSSLKIAQLMSLEKGAVIRLDQRIGDPVEMQVNGRSLARGELVVKEDDLCFGLKITEIVGVDRAVAPVKPSEKPE